MLLKDHVQMFLALREVSELFLDTKEGCRISKVDSHLAQQLIGKKLDIDHL